VSDTEKLGNAVRKVESELLQISRAFVFASMVTPEFIRKKWRRLRGFAASQRR